MLIVGIIGFTIAVLAILFTAITISGTNDIKCPKCGTEMRFIGNVIGTDTEDKVFNTYHKHPAYKHVYKCPKCGDEYVI